MVRYGRDPYSVESTLCIVGSYTLSKGRFLTLTVSYTRDPYLSTVLDLVQRPAAVSTRSRVGLAVVKGPTDRSRTEKAFVGLCAG